MRLFFISIIALVAINSASCQAMFDNYEFDGDGGGDTDTDSDTDTDTDTDSDTDSETDTDSDTECPSSTHNCVEDAIAGWTGPSVVYMGSSSATPPACAGDYPTTGALANTNLDIPSASCGCACTAQSGATCTGSGTLENHGGSTPACSYISPPTYTINTTCTVLGSGHGTSNYWRFDASGFNVSGGSCSTLPTISVPTPNYQTDVISCHGAIEGGTCVGDDVCIPIPAAPYESELCIWASGNVLCPSTSTYTERFVYYTSFTDSRSCEACACGSPVGDCLNSSVTLMDNTSCTLSFMLGNIPGDNTCTLGISGSVTIMAAELSLDATASCIASVVSVVGDVTEQGPHTFCCLP